MISKDGIIARYLFAFCLFFLSGTGMVSGWTATSCGILGTVELATALNRWSPLAEAFNYLGGKYSRKVVSAKPDKNGHVHN